MTRDLVIIGCGGFGRELVGVVSSINAASAEPIWQIAGFADDSPSVQNRELVSRLGLEILGQVSDVELKTASHYAVAIANTRTRAVLASELTAIGLTPATLVSPLAHVDHDVSLGPGTIVGHFAAVMTRVKTGSHVHIDRGSQIGHDTVLERFVTIHPMSAVSGACEIVEGAILGTHSSVLPGIAIGAHATVGAGSCVTRSVSAGRTVKGVPAA